MSRRSEARREAKATKAAKATKRTKPTKATKATGKEAAASATGDGAAATKGMSRAWRVPIVLLVPVLLIVALVVQSRVGAPTASETDIVDPTQLMPVVQRPGVASTTFFCAGGTATGKGDGFAEQTVTVANLSGDRRAGKITVYGDKADPVSRPLDVGAHSRVDTKLSDILTSEFASAVVEIAGGEIAVEHTVSGPTGRATSTCASAPSNRWFFPAASTRPGARMVLAVFNPFPEAAVMDIRFETEDGSRTPQAYNPLVVPGGRVTGVDVTGVVTLRRQIATTIETRSGSGRVVVDLLQSFDGKDTPAAGGGGSGPTTTRPAATTGSAPGTTVAAGASSVPIKDRGLKGLAVLLGAPAPVTSWLFPDGPPLADGVDEQYVVMNPGTEPVVVDVQVRVDNQEQLGPIEPYEVTIRPSQYAIVSVTQDGRIPPGVGHWASVTSRGGRVVAARVLTAVHADAANPPANTGYSNMMGTPLGASRWLVAAADLEGTSAAVVTIANPSSSASAQITVRTAQDGRVEPLARFDHVDLGPGARTIAPIGERKGGNKIAVIVESSQPVIVEQRVTFDSSSFSNALGEPQTDTVVLPPPSWFSPPEIEPAGVPGTGPLLTTDGTATPGSGPPGTAGDTIPIGGDSPPESVIDAPSTSEPAPEVGDPAQSSTSLPTDGVGGT